MRVRLLCSLGKRKPFGTVMTVTVEAGEEMISSGIAEEYKGEYPPRLRRGRKHRMNLSQIKTK